MQHSAQEIGERLKDAVEYNLPRLLAISEEDANRRAGPDPGWSRKQELGHLIDSATNNRVRFVVAGLTGKYAGPTYDGDGWVDLGGYSHAPWIDLIELWERLNRSLAPDNPKFMFVTVLLGIYDAVFLVLSLWIFEALVIE